MLEFDYESQTTLTNVLQRIDRSRQVLAGGTDLLTRMKAGLDQPTELLDIKPTELDSELTLADDELVLGALCTLSDVDESSLDGCYQLLKDAAGQAATQQIRNRATVAGNLLQAPRCWYYRHPDVDCWRKGGTQCPAREGRNSHHAIVEMSPCVAVHPSDLAACLIALEASVDIVSREGQRSEKVADFLMSPVDDHRRETILKSDEIVTAIRVPALGEGYRSCYLKAMDRKVWAFALCGVAAAVDLREGKLHDVRLCLSGVANTPVRLKNVEAMLRGREPSTQLFEEAINSAVDDFTPLSENGYKVDLVKGLLKNALEQLSK